MDEKPVSAGPPGPPGPSGSLTVRQRVRHTAYWFVTALDDVFVEKFWTRLRAGRTGLAFRELGDTLLGWWRLLAIVAAAVTLVWILVD